MDKEKLVTDFFESLVKRAMILQLEEFAKSIQYKAENIEMFIDDNEPEVIHVKVDLRLDPKDDKTVTTDN